ncbi:MAG: apolipoprotein N-acyltransferase [Verrucomicrobiaceae bacterium]
MRRLIRPILALASGAALALCFAPFNQSWIVWGWMWVLLPLLWTVGPEKPRRAGFGLAYLSGLGFWFVNLKWIFTVTSLGAVTMAVYFSVYFGCFGAFAAVAGNPWRKSVKTPKGVRDRFREMGRSLGVAALLGGFWCGMEWIRGWMLTGFGWNGLGTAFFDSLVLAQNAEFVGVIGLSFLPVFFSAVVVQVARRFYLQGRDGGVKLLHWDFATALLVIMTAFTIGTVRLTSVTNQEMVEGRALLIQQNIPQVAGQVSWEPQRIISGFVELTEKGLEEADEEVVMALQEAGEGVPISVRRPDLVVWPEACLPEWFFIGDDGVPRAGAPMESFLDYAKGLGEFALVTGITEVDGNPASADAKVYNSIMIDDGEGRQTYQKHHLVYFGEAIPDIQFLRDIYKNTTGVEFGGGLTPGKVLLPMEVEMGGEQVGIIPSVCFEDTVPRLARRFVRPGPQLIINVTNDGWFHESEGAMQHFQNSIFRAIELRRPMVRCANRGVTGVISVTGSTVDPETREERLLLDEDGSHFHRGALLASVQIPKDGEVTLYSKWGDWFAVTGLLCGLLRGGFVRLRNS